MFAPYGLPDYKTFLVDKIDARLLRAARKALRYLEMNATSIPDCRREIESLRTAIHIAEERPPFLRRLAIVWEARRRRSHRLR